MDVHGFPACCGINIITGVSGITSNDLADAEKRSQGAPIALIASAAYQNADKVLKQNGWLPVFTFRNCNSDNYVTLWMKSLHTSHSTEVKFRQDKTP